MTLTFNLLGFDIAKVELTLPEDKPGVVTAADKAKKGLSSWFFKGMIK